MRAIVPHEENHGKNNIDNSEALPTPFRGPTPLEAPPTSCHLQTLRYWLMFNSSTWIIASKGRQVTPLPGGGDGAGAMVTYTPLCPCANCLSLCPYDSESSIILEQLSARCQLRPLAVWGGEVTAGLPGAT